MGRPGPEPGKEGVQALSATGPHSHVGLHQLWLVPGEQKRQVPQTGHGGLADPVGKGRGARQPSSWRGGGGLGTCPALAAQSWCLTLSGSWVLLVASPHSDEPCPCVQHVQGHPQPCPNHCWKEGRQAPKRPQHTPEQGRDRKAPGPTGDCSQQNRTSALLDDSNRIPEADGKCGKPECAGPRDRG